VVISLERVADLHMSQLMPLPPIVSCFSKIQIGFTFLVPAYPGSPPKRAVKRVSVTTNYLTQTVQISRQSIWVENINMTYDCTAPPNPKPTKPRNITIHA